ncbi:MAG: hypothetical protein H6574_08340 [Lewinellaceae bacterium]|nr:hypothetical protein [Lewinellaceae bacterium]
MFLFNELINKGVDRPYANPDFAKSEAVLAKPCLSDDEGRRVELGFYTAGDFKQNRGIYIQPDFFGSFAQGKKNRKFHYQRLA